MYKYVLNLVIKISLMFAQYFEYYAIILRGAVFLWTQCIYVYLVPFMRYSLRWVQSRSILIPFLRLILPTESFP